MTSVQPLEHFLLCGLCTSRLCEQRKANLDVQRTAEPPMFRKDTWLHLANRYAQTQSHSSTFGPGRFHPFIRFAQFRPQLTQWHSPRPDIPLASCFHRRFQPADKHPTGPYRIFHTEKMSVWPNLIRFERKQEYECMCMYRLGDCLVKWYYSSLRIK